MKNNLLLIVSIFCACLICNPLSAQSKKKYKLTAGKTKKNEKKFDGEMRTYYLVLLKKGPKRDQDSATANEIQAGHMANIEKLAKEGKLAIAGPVAEDADLRGIFIFDAKNKEEVEGWIKVDPAISSGRLIYEIYPWMSMKGATLP